MNIIICLLIMSILFENLLAMDNADKSQKAGKSVQSANEKRTSKEEFKLLTVRLENPPHPETVFTGNPLMDPACNYQVPRDNTIELAKTESECLYEQFEDN
ncbi:hypothetical protein GPALN_014379 [Globodera pallida]|nr:hypothetical protein GPALN_014379 [Globodera pallida]